MFVKYDKKLVFRVPSITKLHVCNKRGAVPKRIIARIVDEKRVICYPAS